MNKENLDTTVRLSSQRALLGAITPAIRMITIGWNEMSLFKIRAYFDMQPTDEQVEAIEVACTEIIADIPFDKAETECVYSAQPIKDLEVFRYIVYLRYEK